MLCWRRRVRNAGWTTADVAAKRARLEDGLLAAAERPHAYVEGTVEDVPV